MRVKEVIMALEDAIEWALDDAKGYEEYGNLYSGCKDEAEHKQRQKEHHERMQSWIHALEYIKGKGEAQWQSM